LNNTPNFCFELYLFMRGNRLVSMKIAIDRDGCIECGSCENLCPQVFHLPPDDKSTVVEKFRKGKPGEGEVGPDLETCVVEAREACPVQVIHTV
jgi:ferredoxin